MTSERYVEKELARLALAKMLMIPFTADVTKEPEADLLMLGSATYHVVLVREVEGNVVFDPFVAVGDYTAFVLKLAEATYSAVGYLSNDESQNSPLWREGRVSMVDLSPMEELAGVGIVRDDVQ